MFLLFLLVHTLHTRLIIWPINIRPIIMCNSLCLQREMTQLTASLTKQITDAIVADDVRWIVANFTHGRSNGNVGRRMLALGQHVACFEAVVTKGSPTTINTFAKHWCVLQWIPHASRRGVKYLAGRTDLHSHGFLRRGDTGCTIKVDDSIWTWLEDAVVGWFR